MNDAERTKELRSKYLTNFQRARHRLPVLAGWLREVSEYVNGAKFNLDVYADWMWREQHDDPPRNVQEASTCGFEGCGLGWAPLCPTLRKRGLKGDRFGFWPAIDEAEEFFGINSDASWVIFGESDTDWRDGGPAGHRINCHDPIAAAERVERFMGDMGIKPLPHEPPPSQTTT